MKNMFDLTSDECVERMNLLVNKYMRIMGETEPFYKETVELKDKAVSRAKRLTLSEIETAVNKKYTGIIETNGEHSTVDNKVDLCLINSVVGLLCKIDYNVEDLVAGIIQHISEKNVCLRTTNATMCIVSDSQEICVSRVVAVEIFVLLCLTGYLDIKVERGEGFMVTGVTKGVINFTSTTLNTAWVAAVKKGATVDTLSAEVINKSFGGLH